MNKTQSILIGRTIVSVENLPKQTIVTLDNGVKCYFEVYSGGWDGEEYGFNFSYSPPNET